MPFIHSLTAFSIIRATKPFDAEVFPIIKAPISGITENIKTLPAGLEFIVATPEGRIYEEPDKIVLIPEDPDVEYFIEKQLISEKWLSFKYYGGFNVIIEWKQFLDSFIIVNLFDYKDLDYTNELHLSFAIRQHLADPAFPLYLPASVFDEINEYYEEYSKGFILYAEYVTLAFYSAQKAIDSIQKKKKKLY